MFSSHARRIPIALIFLAAIFCSTISHAQQEPAPTTSAQTSNSRDSRSPPPPAHRRSSRRRRRARPGPHRRAAMDGRKPHPGRQTCRHQHGRSGWCRLRHRPQRRRDAPARQKVFTGTTPCSPNPATVNFPIAANKTAATTSSAANSASSTASTAPTDSIPATVWASCSTACPLPIPPCLQFRRSAHAVPLRGHRSSQRPGRRAPRWLIVAGLCALPWPSPACSLRRNSMAKCWSMAALSITFPPTWSAR
jgi:cell division protein FtsN